MNVFIVGGGKVGVQLATLLYAGGHVTTVIEQRAEHVAEAQRLAPDVPILLGSGTDPDFLERLGVRQAQVLAAVTGSDETNLAATCLARFEFRVPRTIARVNNPRNAWLFTHDMGVDVALNQADLMARLIQEEMSLGEMMTLLKLRRGQVALVEEKVHPQAAAAGKAVRDLDLPDECALTAILRGGRLIVPRGGTVLLPDDEVLALVHADDAPRLAAVLSAGNLET